MNQAKPPESVSDLIARYRQELLALHKQQAPAPTSFSDERLDAEFPMPNIERDREALADNPPPAAKDDAEREPATKEESVTEEVPVTKEEPMTEEEPTFPYTDQDLQGQVPRAEQELPPGESAPAYTGYLRVFVYTANSAEPLRGATVTVTAPENGDALYASVTTDEDGFTPLIPLPSVSPSLTLQPEVLKPYVSYNIRVFSEGFATTVYENVPIYGDNYATQPAAMVPLLPGQNREDIRTFPSNGPADL